MNNKQVSIFFRTYAPMNKIMTYLYLVILTATGDALSQNGSKALPGFVTS